MIDIEIPRPTAALRETLSTMAAQLVDSIPLIETIALNPPEGI